MFMGTPQIAAECLDILHKKHDVCCVVTKTDKPKGRSGALAFSDVKEKALLMGIDVVQPITLKNGSFAHVLEKYKPDVIIVVAYGLILPKYVLDFPKYGCINLHASLLPKYRGAAPIQWCIANGEKTGGITAMLMDEGLDTGDMLLKAEVEIAKDVTGGQLHDIYCKLGGQLLLDTLDALENGEITPQKQDDLQHTYAPMLTKENTRINWNDTPQKITDLVRAMNPYPTAYTTLSGKKLKIFSCYADTSQSGESGRVISAKDNLTVACNGGAVVITELQLEGKKRMLAGDFLRGYKVNCGEMLI